MTAEQAERLQSAVGRLYTRHPEVAADVQFEGGGQRVALFKPGTDLVGGAKLPLGAIDKLSDAELDAKLDTAVGAMEAP